VDKGRDPTHLLEGRWSSFGKIEQPVGTLIVSVAEPEIHASTCRDALPIQPRRRRARPRQPVEHQVVEQLVARDDLLQVVVVIGPGPELLRDPRGEGRRRVDQRVSDRLGPRSVFARVAGIPSGRVLERREGFVFALGEVVEGRRVRRRKRRREVDPDDVLAGTLADERADAGASVAPLRAVPFVPEPPHHLDPRVGDPFDAPARARRLVAEAEAGE
jgi:hypothetical protein